MSDSKYRQQYRECLFNMTHEERMRVELEMLSELNDIVASAQRQFDKYGGAGRVNTLEAMVDIYDGGNSNG